MALSPRVRAALIPRAPAPIRGFFGVVFGVGLCVAGVLIASAIDVPPGDAGYSDAYLKAARTGAMSTAVWACLFFSGGAWVIGESLRAWFGVPEQPVNAKIAWLRGGVAAVLLGWLILWGGVGDSLKWTNPDASPDRALALALGVWGVIAFDLKDLVGDAVAMLRARLPALMARAATLESLPGSGVVKVGGTIVTGPAEPLDDGRIYRWNLAGEDAEPEGVPFVLEDGGHRAGVELHPARATVIADPDGYGHVSLRPGDEVTVVGTVEGEAGPYRGGIARLAAPSDAPLRILAGSSSWNRRLITAAIVELAAAAAMLGAAVLLLVFRLRL